MPRIPKQTGLGVYGRKLIETLSGYQLKTDTQVKGYGQATRAKRVQKISQGIFDTLLPSLSHKKE